MQTLGVTESNKKRMLEVSSLGPHSSNTIRNTTDSKFKVIRESVNDVYQAYIRPHSSPISHSTLFYSHLKVDLNHSSYKSF